MALYKEDSYWPGCVPAVKEKSSNLLIFNSLDDCSGERGSLFSELFEKLSLIIKYLGLHNLKKFHTFVPILSRFAERFCTLRTPFQHTQEPIFVPSVSRSRR